MVHLRVRSSFSMGESILTIDKIIDLCIENQMPACCIADNNNMFGALEFSYKAVSKGIQPIMGAIVDIQYHDSIYPIVLFAQTDKGYKNLLKLVSARYIDKIPSIETLSELNHDIIITTGGFEGMIYNECNTSLLEDLIKIFVDRIYIEVMRVKIPLVQEHKAIELAHKYSLPIVCTCDIRFDSPASFDAFDVMSCIHNGDYIHSPNRKQLSPESYFRSAQEMKDVFADMLPGIENATTIAKRCSFWPEPSATRMPSYKIDDGKTEYDVVIEQCQCALTKLLGEHINGEPVVEQDKHAIYHERLTYELDLLTKMGFLGYFLIVADFIQWAKNHNIPVGPGRGSGAGSLVAYCLKITDIDPIRFGLLFERFLNPERVSLPDFDIDFCQHRREEVIKYVEQKYGKDRVAQIITFGKLQARAVLRDVGRVLQMPFSYVDKICKAVPNDPTNPTTLTQAMELEPMLNAFMEEDHQVKHLIDISLQLEGLYRNVSTHAAGVVISNEPLLDVLPLYKDKDADIACTQFNMKYIEMAGLIKFDFLGLKTLTVIHDTIVLIKKNHNIDLDILQIPLDDKKAFDVICSLKTACIFQFESSGIREVLKTFQPNRIEDIIALVALYRPGPIDNIPIYIQNKNNPQAIRYMHPMLADVLKETFGVIVYQEQVIKIAQVIAGYTLGGADLLRKAMGKKVKAEMDAQRSIFIAGAEKTVGKQLASELFDLIDRFASYAFNKAHAASYGLISYQTAYLKAHYRTEFMAAAMTLDMHNTDKLAIFIDELKSSEIDVVLPDIENSDVTFRALNDHTIVYALGAIKGLGEAVANEICTKRPFKDIHDFCKRVSLNKRSFEQLVYAGALSKFGFNKATLINNMHLFLNQDAGQLSLLSIDIKVYEDYTNVEHLENERKAIGFYISGHPLSDYISALNLPLLSSLKNNTDIKVAGVVIDIIKKRSKKTGEIFAFLSLSDPSETVEMRIDSNILLEHIDLLKVGELITITVKVMKYDGGTIRIVVKHIESFSKTMQATVKQIDIFPNDIAAIAKIKNIITSAQAGGCNINIVSDRSCFQLAQKIQCTVQVSEKLRKVAQIKLCLNI